jgi:hypothetical protein
MITAILALISVIPAWFKFKIPDEEEATPKSVLQTTPTPSADNPTED